MFFFKSIALLPFCTLAFVTVASNPEDNGWKKVDDGNDMLLNENMAVIMGLQINFDHDRFQNRTNPDHPDFRKFDSLEESRNRATEGLDDCRTKLLSDTAAVGLTAKPLTMNKEYFEMSGTGKQILDLFRNSSLTLHRFTQSDDSAGNTTIIRVLPENKSEDIVDMLKDPELRECVGVVLRMVDFPHVPRRRVPKAPFQSGGSTSTQRSLQTCPMEPLPDSRIAPERLLRMYGVPSGPVTNVSSTAPKVVQAVYESNSVKTSTGDFQCFIDTFSLASAKLTGDVESFDTNSCVVNSCGEPNLDEQYMSAMNEGVDISYLGVSSFYEMLINLLNEPDSKLPAVVSISYSAPESPSSQRNLEYMCKEFGTLSLRGVTIFAASGDTGATNKRPFGTCGSVYNVGFPASCPFVTAVGGTTGYEGGTEVVANPSNSGITSGGGFSTIFTSENGYNLDFQAEAVAKYKSSNSLSNSLPGYPTSRSRGLPDISAAATHYRVIIDNKYVSLDGTSAATPVMAGITARAILENGGNRFGCINQILYKNSHIFFDVTKGQNSGAGNSISKCPEEGSKIMGYPAAEGWDPASGLGTLGTYPEGAHITYSAALAHKPLPPVPAPTNPPPFSKAYSTQNGGMAAVMLSLVFVIGLSLF